MTDLWRVTSIEVPLPVLQAGHAHLRRVGMDGLEGFVLWIGVQDGEIFRVQEAVIPQQSGLRQEEGVCVVVQGEELHRLNVLLHERNLTLIAQIHSHPTNAYHSSTDDTYPIVTRAGGISLVVPDFALQPFSLANSAVYRLSPEGQWNELSTDAVWRLIRVVG
jgi:hypothetical protein